MDAQRSAAGFAAVVFEVSGMGSPTVLLLRHATPRDTAAGLLWPRLPLAPGARLAMARRRGHGALAHAPPGPLSGVAPELSGNTSRSSGVGIPPGAPRAHPSTPHAGRASVRGRVPRRGTGAEPGPVGDHAPAGDGAAQEKRRGGRAVVGAARYGGLLTICRDS
jgi:hypothetical protein